MTVFDDVSYRVHARLNKAYRQQQWFSTIVHIMKHRALSFYNYRNRTREESCSNPSNRIGTYSEVNII